MKKCNIIMYLLFTVVLLLISACSNSVNINSANENDPQKSGELFNENDMLNIVVPSDVSWPYNENWAYWKYLKKAVGGTLSVKAIPSTEFPTKLSLMMASKDTLPDLLYVWSKHHIDSYALTNAFLSVEDNIDKLPNYEKFWNSVPEQERNKRLQVRLSGDGKTYFPQLYGVDRIQNHYTWLYRKDIFGKNNLTVPETWDSVYETSKKLKELYPDSYPFLFTGLGNLAAIGPQWKPYFQHYVYYDFDNEKWNYGAAENTMLDIIKFFNKMRDEELVAPDFLTINRKSADELISTDRGFIMITFASKADYYNKPNRTSNPDYTWDFMKPPSYNGDTINHRISQIAPFGWGYAVCNTGNNERIEKAFRLVDWFYTDEAAELMSWGMEGETYEIIDGNKHLIIGDNEMPREKYGALTYGLFQRVDEAVSYETQSDEQNSILEKAMSFEEEYVNPKFWMAFSDEEFSRREELRPAIESYTDEMISKFIIGIISLSEWDEFQKNLKDLGIEELLSIHESAYNRTLKAIS